ncbi:hypothetical protein ACIBG0_33355 [Nocardia sp. NPDC050630]|uniref:hypothetical protein n=1 Tax=Nocardia sp. NPDC050630 TaxID=3364321 RepID=UPI0037945C50
MKLAPVQRLVEVGVFSNDVFLSAEYIEYGSDLLEEHPESTWTSGALDVWFVEKFIRWLKITDMEIRLRRYKERSFDDPDELGESFQDVATDLFASDLQVAWFESMFCGLKSQVLIPDIGGFLVERYNKLASVCMYPIGRAVNQLSMLKMMLDAIDHSAAEEVAKRARQLSKVFAKASCHYWYADALNTAYAAEIIWRRSTESIEEARSTAHAALSKVARDDRLMLAESVAEGSGPAGLLLLF